MKSLKLSSFACKTVDFTDQNIKHRRGLMELSFKDLKMQKWDVPTDRDKKNEVIFLVIMFTQEDLSAVLKCFAQTATNLLLSSENTKKSHVLNFNNQTLDGNMIFTIFKHLNMVKIMFYSLSSSSYLLFELYLLVYLIFTEFRVKTLHKLMFQTF